MASAAATLPRDTKGTKVNIVCWLLAALSAVFLVLRLFCKFKTHRGLWWDDHVLIVSWVCSSKQALSLSSSWFPHPKSLTN